MLQLWIERAWIRLRGVEFRARDASQIPAEELIRLDTYWTLASVLTVVNTLRGKEFQNRHLLLALRLGEPYRVALAIAMESGYSGLNGWHAKRRTGMLVRRAVVLAEEVRRPQAMGFAQQTALAACYLEGRWKEAWALAQTAEAIFRERCTNVAWEL